MANFNKVMMIGNLTRDPELRTLPSGTSVCETGLATNRRYRTQDGQDREETCFIDLVVFGRQAEVLQQYKKKGDPLFIEGRLKLDTWEAQDGSKRSKHRIVIENFQFLGRGGNSDSSGGSFAPASASSSSSRYTEPVNENAGSFGGGGGGNFNESDVPF